MQYINNPTYNSFITIQYNEYIHDELVKLFPNTLNLSKKELAKVLNLSVGTVSNRLSEGTLDVKYIRTGESMQCGLLFPIVAVAEYLTKQLCETMLYEAA